MKIVKNNKKEAMIVNQSLQWIYYEFIFYLLNPFALFTNFKSFILIKFSFLRNIKFFFRDDGLDEVIFN